MFLIGLIIPKRCIKNISVVIHKKLRHGKGDVSLKTATPCTLNVAQKLEEHVET